MPQAHSDRLAPKANQLYWQTDRPAGQLASELGVSRSKFYAMIEPLELEGSCETCGGGLVFGSRTDREAGRARCSECAAIVQVPPEVAAVAGPLEPSQDTDQRPAPDAETASDLATGEGQPPVIWWSAAAGLVFGLLTAAWLRRR